MYIVSAFEHNLSLELAIMELEKKGLSNILAIPLEGNNGRQRLFDTIHGSDGMSLFDLAAIFATIFMVLGVIYGFVLKGGPVIWGLLGGIVGFMIGFFIDLFIGKSNRRRNKSDKRTAEVVVIVECDEWNAETVKNILWDHFAIGVSKVR